MYQLIVESAARSADSLTTSAGNPVAGYQRSMSAGHRIIWGTQIIGGNVTTLAE